MRAMSATELYVYVTFNCAHSPTSFSSLKNSKIIYVGVDPFSSWKDSIIFWFSTCDPLDYVAKVFTINAAQSQAIFFGSFSSKKILVTISLTPKKGLSRHIRPQCTQELGTKFGNFQSPQSLGDLAQKLQIKASLNT